MMISPEAYIDRFKGAEYLDLITERDRLIRFIKEYEEKDIAGDRSGKEWGIYPQQMSGIRYIWSILAGYAF